MNTIDPSDPTIIDIKGIDKAALLCALYNAARPRGMGHLHATAEPMTIEQAEEHLNHRTYFDYLNGRLLKVELKHPVLYTRTYDRDNGTDAARRAIAHLLPIHA